MKFKAWSGKLVSVSDEAIMIREEWKQQEITVERPNVLRVTDLQCSSRARNATIGLLSGTLLGATRSTEGSAYKAVLAGVFGGMGAGIGALVPSYPTIYRIKAGSSTPASNPPGSSADQ